MEHNRIPIAPEAATDEPASPAISARAEPPDDPLCPDFDTEAEEHAYWQGVTVGLCAGAPVTEDAPGGDPRPFESRRQRRARHDGFSPARQTVFLEAISEGKTVARAAAAAGISTNTAYNLRNRREGRAFDLGWEAAIRRGRKVLADRLRDRAIEGQVATRYDKDGNVVGTRHYHDNRLAQAALARLDARVEAARDDERLITAVSDEFEELLDCIEDSGDTEAFIEACRPPPVELGNVRIREGGSDAEFAARWRHLMDADEEEDERDPGEIDISDLDPDEREEWTDEQWDRAEASGLLLRWEGEMEGKAKAAGEAEGDEQAPTPRPPVRPDWISPLSRTSPGPGSLNNPRGPTLRGDARGARRPCLHRRGRGAGKRGRARA
jgi:hypothetical protein